MNLHKTTFNKESTENKIITGLLYAFFIFGLIYNIYILIILQDITWGNIGVFSFWLLISRFFGAKNVWNKKMKKMTYGKAFIFYIGSIIKTIFIFLILLTLFSVYHNEVNPAQLSVYTLSNGEKEVKFFQMAHIASKNYYDIIDNEIEKLGKEGYILFYEGVELDVSQTIIKDKLGLLPTKETYANLTTALGDGVAVQDVKKTLEIAEDVRNTDVKFSELLTDKPITAKSNTGTYNIKEQQKLLVELNKELEELHKDKKIEDKKVNNNTKEDKKVTNDKDKKLDTDNKKEDKLSKNNDKNVEALLANSILIKEENVGVDILKYFVKSVFNVTLKYPNTMFKIQSYFLPTQSNFFEEEVIVKRNKKLVLNILESKDDKIMITYGAQHFEGVLKLLQKDDSNWKITDEKKIIIFK